MLDALHLIGPGRLGRSLAELLRSQGVVVSLSGRGEPVPRMGVVWITVPDAEVATVAATLPPGPVVLHASGALGVEVLRPHAPAGSLHPLMTFPGPHALPDLRDVPAAVAGDAAAVAVAVELATRLGMRPVRVPGDRRLYHAAAVMAGNFATVLLADAARALVAAGVPAREAAGVLLPLALQSLRNAANGPARALTGPVARGDLATLAAHRAALAEASLQELLPMYDALLDRARALLAESVGSDRSDAASD